MTVDEYLAWSESQGERQRTELINGPVVAMAPERIAHNRIKGAVYLALRRAVAAAKVPCEVMTGGVTVRIDQHTAYVPDALIYCGEKLRGETIVVPEPAIIVEVLSPTTAHTDTSAKLIGYFKLPSVAHYLLLGADSHTVTHYTRSNPPTLLASGPLRLDPPGLDVTVEELLGRA